VDLVITGLVGLRPRADDSVEVRPLASESWPYFALDGVRYHGHTLSILWDRTGNRYRRGKGLVVIADGRTIARSAHLTRAVALLGPPLLRPRPDPLVNFAVNNGAGAYPSVHASFSAENSPVTRLIDGNYWYHVSPPNRWMTVGSQNARDTVTVDFGTPRVVEQLKLYFLDDGPGAAVRAPERYAVQVWNGNAWVDAPVRERKPANPTGHRANVVSLARQTISRIRVILEPQRGAAVGMTEVEVWGPKTEI
jgi:hypothetical protein